MLWHVLHVHCLLARTEFTATVAQMHMGPHAVRLKLMQNGDNYFKNSHLMPPKRPWIDGLSATGHRCVIQYMQITLQHELQFRVTVKSDTAQVFDLYFTDSTSSWFQLMTTWVAGRTGHRLTMLFPFWHGVQSTEVYRLKNSICLSPQSLTKDPRLQSIAICNLDPAVVSCLNVYLYSYQPVW